MRRQNNVQLSLVEHRAGWSYYTGCPDTAGARGLDVTQAEPKSRARKGVVKRFVSFVNVLSLARERLGFKGGITRNYVSDVERARRTSTILLVTQVLDAWGHRLGRVR